MELLDLVERYGLPLVMLVSFAYLVTGDKRRLVPRSESDGWRLLYEREREDRIAAQKTVGEFAPANAKVAEAVAGLSEEVVKRLPALYEERLSGR